MFFAICILLNPLWKQKIFFNDVLGATIEKLEKEKNVNELLKTEPKQVSGFMIRELEQTHKVEIPPHLLKHVRRNLREAFSSKKYELTKAIALGYIEIGRIEDMILAGELTENGMVEEAKRKRLDPEDDLEEIHKIIGKYVLVVLKKYISYYKFGDEFWSKIVNEALEIATGEPNVEYEWLYAMLHRLQFQDRPAKERPKFKIGEWVEKKD